MLIAKPAAKPGTAGETVADVAARCGFTSAAYFSHAFRKHFGVRASDVPGQFGYSGSLGGP
jgi:AraC-like DNA-binding protein